MYYKKSNINILSQMWFFLTEEVAKMYKTCKIYIIKIE